MACVAGGGADGGGRCWAWGVACGGRGWRQAQAAQQNEVSSHVSLSELRASGAACAAERCSVAELSYM